MATTGVAVLIAAKDAGATIARAVRSALAQGQASEIWVFSDGSTDDTAQLARACDDASGRLHVVESSKNVGPAAARNALIAASRSPIVCVLDADDYMLPGRLDRLLAEAGDDWDFAADDLLFAMEGAEDQIIGHLLRDDDLTPRTILAAEFVDRCMNDPARPRREIAFMKPLMRRAFLEAQLVAYDSSLRLGEDYVLYMQCLIRGARMRLVSKCGYVAVTRENSLSGLHTTQDLASFLKADMALLTEPALNSATRRALQAHVRQLRRNYDNREMLDLKRRGDFKGVLALMIRRPDSAVGAIALAVSSRLSPGRRAHA
jgi:succinoglycan biosynthesis protein ExoU